MLFMVSVSWLFLLISFQEDERPRPDLLGTHAPHQHPVEIQTRGHRAGLQSEFVAPAHWTSGLRDHLGTQSLQAQAQAERGFQSGEVAELVEESRRQMQAW